MQQFFSLLSWRLFTAQHVSGVFPPIIKSSMTAVAASGFTFVSWWLVLCSWSGRSYPARPWTQHGYRHDTKVKPEAATAVIELLMMGGKTPETCWAVNKRQDNKLENCCIWLVIYLNCTVMMHRLTKLKLNHNFLQIQLTNVLHLFLSHPSDPFPLSLLSQILYTFLPFLYQRNYIGGLH